MWWWSKGFPPKMKGKKYPAAIEKATYQYTVVVKNIISTNCSNKTEGHSYVWLSNATTEDKERNEEILKEHPSWRGIGLLRCRYCGKYNASM